nr:hypothetical protein [Escherichia coli]
MGPHRAAAALAAQPLIMQWPEIERGAAAAAGDYGARLTCAGSQQVDLVPTG